MSRTQRGTALASDKSEKAPQRKEPSRCLKLKKVFGGGGGAVGSWMQVFWKVMA